MPLQGGDQGLALFRLDAIGLEDFGNLIRLDRRFLHHLGLLANALAGIMLGVTAGGEVST